jgi:hypothetical protein
LAAPSPSAKPTSITPTPATAARLEVFARRDVRQPDRREPARDVADDRDAVLVEVEQPDGDDAKQHGDQRPRHHRRQLTEADDDGQRGEADEERGPTRRAELAEHVPELLEEVPLLLPDTEQLRDLADDDRQGEPDDESLEHGPEMKLARNPSRAIPAASARTSTVMASVAVSAVNSFAPAGERSATVAAESAAVAAIGPTTRWRELPNAA